MLLHFFETKLSAPSLTMSSYSYYSDHKFKLILFIITAGTLSMAKLPNEKYSRMLSSSRHLFHRTRRSIFFRGLNSSVKNSTDDVKLLKKKTNKKKEKKIWLIPIKRTTRRRTYYVRGKSLKKNRIILTNERKEKIAFTCGGWMVINRIYIKVYYLYYYFQSLS